MRLIALALIAITLNACSWIPKPRAIVVGGVDDIIDIDKGALICNTPLPTNEKNSDGTPKKYCIETSEKSRLVSQKAWVILEQYRK